MQTEEPTHRARPLRLSRAQADPAATRLIERHGHTILRSAQRYSQTPEDGEDAYQRGLEILLTKAPAIPEDELLRWLKTVVKHEAFALRRQRERAGAPPASEPEWEKEEQVLWTNVASTHDRVEQHERLRTGAEALARLKPQEVRCLLLLAEGYSYKQICEATGWTYTKVNRCLSEGRRSFVERVSGIESGAECRRLEPLLSAFADGEASARDLATLRPHLKGCLSCKASLRDFRAAPAQVAALVPPVALAAQGSELPTLGGLDSMLNWLHERTALVVLRFQGAVEMASAQKVAAVAASTAALAGGGAATVGTFERPHTPTPRVEREEPARTAERQRAPAAAMPRVVARATPPRPAAAVRATPAAAPARAARKRPGTRVPAEPRARRSATSRRTVASSEFAREFDAAPETRATTASASPASEPVASAEAVVASPEAGASSKPAPKTDGAGAGSAEFSSSPAPVARQASSGSAEFGP